MDDADAVIPYCLFSILSRQFIICMNSLWHIQHTLHGLVWISNKTRESSASYFFFSLPHSKFFNRVIPKIELRIYCVLNCDNDSNPTITTSFDGWMFPPLSFVRACVCTCSCVRSIVVHCLCVCEFRWQILFILQSKEQWTIEFRSERSSSCSKFQKQSEWMK